MALILNIETSTDICSVALAENGKLIALEEETEARSHSAILTILIQRLFEDSNHVIRDLDAVAIAEGPGSFTGLRIGVSAAKGICYALNRPLIAVPTMKAMASAAIEVVKDMEALYCPVIESIKDEVFAGLYSSSLEEIVAPSPQDINLSNLQPFLKSKRIVVLGTGLNKLRDTEKFLVHRHHNSARNLIKIAETLFQAGGFCSLEYFEPLYIKNFIPRKKNSIQ